MGYGKKGNKGKQALASHYEDLCSERNRGIVAIVGGAVVMVLALIFTGLAPVVASYLGADSTLSLMVGGFIATFVGAVFAALGCIRLIQVNPEYKSVKAKIGR